MGNESQDKRIAQANKPFEDANRLHPYYRGKLEVQPKCRIRDFNDFAIWYSPGVAAPCRAIEADPEKVYEMTSKWNYVGVVSDGTRVLGLGDIGPLAGLPVMEGKAILFKYLGAVDAFPIMLDTKDPDKFIETVKLLQPTFGGFNLEDIAQPKCFRILDTLRAECDIPVWHDDQQGTAAILLSGLYNAAKVAGRTFKDLTIAMVGAGAANVRFAALLESAGINMENMIVCDSRGTLHVDREDRDRLQREYPEKWWLCERTNPKRIQGGIPEAMKDRDFMVSLSTPGPGIIQPEWIETMNPDPIVFACANPTPEIWPWEAKEAGAKVVATGRSDFPNQVNNSMGFPAIFRGTLDVRAKTITDNMCIAAAKELARFAEEKGIHEEYIVPTMDEWEVYPREAAAVGMQAVADGVAGVTDTSFEQLRDKASAMIRESREKFQTIQREFITDPDAE